MHIEESISYLSPLLDMQETGQLAAHAPQAMHLSVILYAINFTTFYFILKRLPLWNESIYYILI